MQNPNWQLDCLVERRRKKSAKINEFELLSFRFSSSHSASSGGGRASVSSEGADNNDEDSAQMSFSNASSPAAEKAGNFVSTLHFNDEELYQSEYCNCLCVFILAFVKQPQNMSGFQLTGIVPLRYVKNIFLSTSNAMMLLFFIFWIFSHQTFFLSNSELLAQNRI